MEISTKHSSEPPVRSREVEGPRVGGIDEAKRASGGERRVQQQRLIRCPAPIVTVQGIISVVEQPRRGNAAEHAQAIRNHFRKHHREHEFRVMIVSQPRF